MSATRTFGLLVVLATLPAHAASPPQARAKQTVAAAYPGLAAGVLASAELGDLPPGVLVRSGQIEITATEFDGLLAKAPAAKRAELRDAAIFLVGELAAKKLLLRAARAAAAKAGASVEGKSDYEIANGYLQAKAAGVAVTEAEIAAFYEENRAMFGGAKLDDVRPNLQDFLLKQKRQKAIREHILGLGSGLVASAPWVKEQAARASANPVDEARASGKPSVVDFGADGCRPCDLMAPILERLKTKYEGRANVVFVHVRRKPMLGRRYGIESIPTQIFFDKGGKEVYRHTGYYSEQRIEGKLREMGVR